MDFKTFMDNFFYPNDLKLNEEIVKEFVASIWNMALKQSDANVLGKVKKGSSSMIKK